MNIRSCFTTPPPATAVQIAPRSVSAAVVAHHGRATVVTAHAVEPIPPGLVKPALNAQNLTDRQAVGEAVRRVLGRLGSRPRRIALVVPDSLAKVSLVRIDRVPPRRTDLDQLIRWHVRKAAPFPLDDAQVSYTPGAALPEGGREYIVVLARRAVIEEYEAACRQTGAHAGLVDLATFSLINAVVAGTTAAAGDWLLVHVTPEYGTLVILRGPDPILFRNRTEGGEDSLADLVHQTAMYYEDRLGGHGFSRVLVAGSLLDETSGGGLDTLRRQISDRLRIQTETVDPARVARFSDRIAVDAGLIQMVAPLIGVLARDRVA